MTNFLPMQEKIGLYPIVNSVEWVEKLLQWGVKTIQLRMKSQTLSTISDAIARSVALAKVHDAQLFINDYWSLAIKHSAFGVHLGQEDIVDADVAAIQQAGLRLGVSTHSELEIKKGFSYQPSYLAFGPVYATTSKQMSYSSQGLDRLSACCQQVDLPVVAIGGIDLSRVNDVLVTGVDGVAILSAIVSADNAEMVVKKLLAMIEG